MKAIINHFNPKIDSWKSQNDIESLTEENVLEIVKDNYDSLTLKMYDGLDTYENYSSESEKETLFFREILEQVVSEYCESLKQRQNNLQDGNNDYSSLLDEMMTAKNA